jgi:hypothetical protein
MYKYASTHQDELIRTTTPVPALIDQTTDAICPVYLLICEKKKSF